jgi:hypothetical protein
MKTVIITGKGNETIQGELVFRVLMNRSRKDQFRYTNYSEVLTRLGILERIFKYTRFEIVVENK